MNPQDEHWMKRALELAERGRGHVEPNPLVGALVVQEGTVVGEGWHQHYGQPHAEVNALNLAGEAAHGATLYVTLEPCCHYGKTPPCTEAVIGAGIPRVVVAMLDPSPKVDGQGCARLRAAGIAVELGVCAAEARRFNAPYLKLLRTGRPYVHAKWAMTLDGKLATRTGDSRWISNEASRRRVHQLRGRMDAIVVGLGTVLTDNPLLTVRPPGPRTPVRLVLDSRLSIPLESQLVRTARAVPTLLVTTAPLLEGRQEALLAAGCEVLVAGNSGRPEIPGLLEELGRRRQTNLLVEGGAEVLGSFVAADAIDEFHVFIAPRIAGGREAKSPIGGQGVAKMADALALQRWEILEMSGGDVLLHGWRTSW